MTGLEALGAAGIGALISAVVSAGATVYDHFAQRAEHRRELALEKALELAGVSQQLVREAVRETGGRGWIRDRLVVAGEYYPLVKELLEREALPEDFQALCHKFEVEAKERYAKDKAQ